MNLVRVDFMSTDPSSLAVHMNAPDVLCQIRAAAEVLQTEVPAAGVSYCLRSRRAGTAKSIHHGRGGASTGHRALHLHQGAADTEGGEGGLEELNEYTAGKMWAGAIKNIVMAGGGFAQPSRTGADTTGHIRS